MSHLMYKIQPNQRYGRLTTKSAGSSNTKIPVICDCGKTTQVTGSKLRNGTTQSCGCLKHEVVILQNTTHGLTQHDCYPLWAGVIQRCFNLNEKRYADYGGRGITMQQSWQSNAAAFIHYVESLPDYENRKRFGLTLDRINNDGHYEEGNLRWATQTQQASNRRDSGGKTQETDRPRIGWRIPS